MEYGGSTPFSNARVPVSVIKEARQLGHLPSGPDRLAGES
jgi:hypothetical protein